jgi:hypothetical protein
MSVQSFKTTIIPILGLPFKSFEKKSHLDVTPPKNHIIYYRKWSGASS